MVRRDICWGVDTYWKICVRGKGRGAGGGIGTCLPSREVGEKEKRCNKDKWLRGGGEGGRGEG